MAVYIFHATSIGNDKIFLLIIGIITLYRYLSSIHTNQTHAKQKPKQGNHQHKNHPYNPDILPLKSSKYNQIESPKQSHMPIKTPTIPKLTSPSNKTLQDQHPKISSKKKILLACELFKRKY